MVVGIEPPSPFPRAPRALRVLVLLRALPSGARVQPSTVVRLSLDTEATR